MRLQPRRPVVTSVLAAKALQFFQFPVWRRPFSARTDIDESGLTKAQRKHARQCRRRLALAKRGNIGLVESETQK